MEKRKRPFREKLVDKKSYDLAEHFLSDYPDSNVGDRKALADVIQQAVEDWLGKADAALREKPVF